MCAHAEVLCTDITCSFSISRFLKGYEATGLVPEDIDQSGAQENAVFVQQSGMK